MGSLDQFKETYITESFELLEEMEEHLLNLDEGSSDIEMLNAIFRCAHSIKGGGGAFGFKKLVDFTHVLEAMLDVMREGKLVPTKEIIDTLLKGVDVVKEMVIAAQEGREPEGGLGADLLETLKEYAQVEGGGEGVVPVAALSEEDGGTAGEFGFYDVTFKPKPDLFVSGNEPLLIIRELMRAGKVKATANQDSLPLLSDIDPEKCYLSWVLEVETDKGLRAIKEAFEFVEDECDFDIEEFGALSMPGASAATAPPAEAAPAGNTPQPKAVEEDPVEKKGPAVTSIRVDTEKVDRLVNMVGELVITQAMLEAQTQSLDLPPEQYARIISGIEELSQHTRELQEAVMSVRMQPVKSIFSRMPRIVRDLSTQLGKDIRIEMKGEGTEIDKTVIEQLSDPLTHMIRNSVDHGIESPVNRAKAGKPEQGVIILSADHSGGRIIIEIADDGAGINREKVLAKAVEKGLVSGDANLADEEIDNLIFAPGFSTAAEVTNVSGRGVGMDVVRRNIIGLGGTIDLENNPGQGSTVTISLPLTLAILDGMITRVGEENYIIPISNIIESLRPKAGDVKRVADGGEVINVRGEYIPILYLHKVFEIGDPITDPSKALVVLVESGRHKLGVVVDELVGQQQVVIKSIEENADPVAGVSGATILGDGNVALILDIGGLHKMVDRENRQKKRAA